MFTVSVESEVSDGVMVSFVDMKFVWLIWQLGAAKFRCRATVNGEFFPSPPTKAFLQYSNTL